MASSTASTASTTDSIKSWTYNWLADCPEASGLIRTALDCLSTDLLGNPKTCELLASAMRLPSIIAETLIISKLNERNGFAEKTFHRYTPSVSSDSYSGISSSISSIISNDYVLPTCPGEEYSPEEFTLVNNTGEEYSFAATKLAQSVAQMKEKCPDEAMAKLSHLLTKLFGDIDGLQMMKDFPRP